MRGTGSLYYLMYAIQHGLPEDLALDLIQLTLMSRFKRYRRHLPPT